MNDNEIIKALECCKKDDCDNCPNNFGNCYANLAGYALEIIHRLQEENQSQKAKIEALQMDYQQLQNDIVNANMNADHTLEENESQKAEIERLTKQNFELSEKGEKVCIALKTAKAEAVKEFAERLKESVTYIPWCDYPPVQRCIDDAVKEMVGEDK